MKYAINIVVCLDICELIYLKLEMMLNATKLYSLIPVWITLMFVMVEYVREMAVKKSCKYGEYGSFEHLLFLLI